jgi:hypothetical protein
MTEAHQESKENLFIQNTNENLKVLIDTVGEYWR